MWYFADGRDSFPLVKTLAKAQENLPHTDNLTSPLTALALPLQIRSLLSRSLRAHHRLYVPAVLDLCLSSLPAAPTYTPWRRMMTKHPSLVERRWASVVQSLTKTVSQACVDLADIDHFDPDDMFKEKKDSSHSSEESVTVDEVFLSKPSSGSGPEPRGGLDDSPTSSERGLQWRVLPTFRIIPSSRCSPAFTTSSDQTKYTYSTSLCS